MRYPRVALVVVVLSIAVGAAGVASRDYVGMDTYTRTGQVAADFCVAAGLAFVAWYGLALLIGWAYRALTNNRQGGET